jgi:nucleoprotein TPR
MKTRRKSKAAVVATSDDASISSPAAESSGAVGLSLSLPDDLDLDYLSSLLPDVAVETPRPEDIVLLYQLVLSRDTELEATRRELEESQAELQKKDVELDQALQDRESSGKEVEKELDATREELKSVKKERDEFRACPLVLLIYTPLTQHSRGEAELTREAGFAVELKFRIFD